MCLMCLCLKIQYKCVVDPKMFFVYTTKTNTKPMFLLQDVSLDRKITLPKKKPLKVPENDISFFAIKDWRTCFYCKNPIGVKNALNVLTVNVI